jgi:hypothetical protein
MLVLLNYVYNIHTLILPKDAMNEYINGLGWTFITVLGLFFFFGLPLRSFDIFLMVLINDYLFFAPVLRHIIDEVDEDL